MSEPNGIPISIDDLLVQWNTGKQELAKAAALGNRALINQLKAEAARIETPGVRNLLDPKNGDEVSRRIHRVIRAILAAVGETESLTDTPAPS